jgi:hypothetical protein
MQYYMDTVADNQSPPPRNKTEPKIPVEPCSWCTVKI